jgi:hypothetical protein
MLCHERGAVTGGGRLHNVELPNLYSSSHRLSLAWSVEEDEIGHGSTCGGDIQNFNPGL